MRRAGLVRLLEGHPPAGTVVARPVVDEISGHGDAEERRDGHFVVREVVEQHQGRGLVTRAVALLAADTLDRCGLACTWPAMALLACALAFLALTSPGPSRSALAPHQPWPLLTSRGP